MESTLRPPIHTPMVIPTLAIRTCTHIAVIRTRTMLPTLMRTRISDIIGAGITGEEAAIIPATVRVTTAAATDTGAVTLIGDIIVTGAATAADTVSGVDMVLAAAMLRVPVFEADTTAAELADTAAPMVVMAAVEDSRR